MVKRSRELSIEVKEVNEDDTIVFEWNGKDYIIHSNNNVKNMILNTDFDCEVIHNHNHQAMLSVEYIKTGEIFLRQEINPVKYRGADEWMEDI